MRMACLPNSPDSWRMVVRPGRQRLARLSSLQPTMETLSGTDMPWLWSTETIPMAVMSLPATTPSTPPGMHKMRWPDSKPPYFENSPITTRSRV